MIFREKTDKNREQLRIEKEEDLKTLIRHTQHIKMIEVTDKKRFYNLVKSMVECEMKANEHLFVEECPKYKNLILFL